MTSWNMNYCGMIGGPRAGMQHMLDPDEDGNVVCSRPRCGHIAEYVCPCRIEPDVARYLGCPKHTENPRCVMPRCAPWEGSREWVEARRWLPEDMGGDLTLEEADRRARELIHVKR